MTQKDTIATTAFSLQQEKVIITPGAGSTIHVCYKGEKKPFDPNGDTNMGTFREGDQVAFNLGAVDWIVLYGKGAIR